MKWKVDGILTQKIKWKTWISSTWHFANSQNIAVPWNYINFIDNNFMLILHPRVWNSITHLKIMVNLWPVYLSLVTHDLDEIWIHIFISIHHCNLQGVPHCLRRKPIQFTRYPDNVWIQTFPAQPYREQWGGQWGRDGAQTIVIYMACR